MPSKKNNSKTHSKASKFDQNGGLSQSSSVSSSSISSALCPNDDQLLASIDEASARFPSLISRAAFIGRVMEDAVSNSRGFKVWLPESAMASFPQGSPVSASLSSLDKYRNSFPLSALSVDCAERFGFHSSGNMTNEAGNFFALATVFSSSKVLKNGVCLSADLSNTMGCPNTGRIIFIHPVKFHSSTEKVNGDLHGPANGCISLDNCEELYLSPVSCKSKVEIEGTVSKEVDHVPVANGYFSTPTKSSHLESDVSSPYSAQSEAADDRGSLSKTTSLSRASTGMLDLEQALGDEDSREILETCIVTLLTSQSLLSGNFVAIQLLPGLCFFQVVGFKGFSPSSKTLNVMNHYLATPDPDVGKAKVSAFSVRSEKKIRLFFLGSPGVGTSSGLPLAHTGSRFSSESSQVANFPKLGGLSKELAVLKDIILSSAFQVPGSSFGSRATKGVLLHGPPGTGKTSLARSCTHGTGINIFNINGPEIISQYHGETEQALLEVFNKACKASPAVVFIDELDAIAPTREGGGDELSQRMVGTLLDLLDGIARTNGVLVIATTNRPDSIDPALRRSGRLGREIEIGVPSPRQRHEILLTLLSEMEHSLSDKDIQDVAMATHGFVGADLAALCNEAAYVRLRKYLASAASHEVDVDVLQGLGDSVKSDLVEALPCTSVTQNSSEFMDRIGVNGECCLNGMLKVNSDDFEKARLRVRPSAMREVTLEVPKVSWEDVGGQLEVKAQLMEAVLWPQKHADDFERLGTRPPSGVLLFGPPGCSKTLLARAVASEAGLNFLAVKGPELFNKWVGESEKAVRSIFAKARANAPSIIFFDEIDGLAVIRGEESDGVSVGDRVITQLLVELDGLQGRRNVTVIAATNRPDKIDPALLRQGRFGRLLYVGLPNRKDREDIFGIHLCRMPCSSDVSISELSHLTEGCTGADISFICREAAMAAMEENLSASEITMQHMKAGIEQVQPSDVQIYEELSEKFQRYVHSTSEDDDSRPGPSLSNPNHLGFWARARARLQSSVLSLFRLPGFIWQPSSS